MAKPKPQRKPPASPKSSVPPAPPLDPTLALDAATSLLSGRAGKGFAKPASRRESLEFRLLKEGINEPGLTSLDNMLDETDSTSSAKRSSSPLSQHNKGQVGHNQTFGPDVSRSGVPRRTGG